ncbi:MAG: hypothetical protein JSV71_04120, partial [Nitrospiraceae bacterium]
MQKRKEFLIDSLHIFILVSLAFAQPLYVISRYAEFFIAHEAKPVDVVLVLLIPCFLIPALFVFIEYVAGVFSQRLRKNIHYVFVTILMTVVSLIILKKYAEGISGNIILITAAFSGISLAFAYIRLQEVQKFLTILSPVIFIFPYLFLFDSPINKVVFSQKESRIEEKVTSPVVNIEDPPPIVMVIFDEFLVTSLMSEKRTIDSKRYPNFAELAKESTWFRNATTVGDNTGYAVPSIMTGKYPEHSILPILADQPDNNFT